MKTCDVRADWISLADLLHLTGWNDRMVRRKCAAGELRTRKNEVGRNGKRLREYDANSLASEFQMKRLQQNIAAAPLVLIHPSDKALPKLLPAPGSEKVIRSLASLDDAAREQAEQRLQIIAPMIDFANHANGAQGLFQISNSLSGIVKSLSATLPYPERTIWRWWKSYKTGGPGALADKPRSDKNVSRFFADHKEASAFAYNKFLNERLSVRLVHEALEREWHRLRLNAGDSTPSYETTRCFLNSLSPLISAIGRKGETAYNNDFAPYLLRDISKVRVNQYWISDHMSHDVFVRNIDLETGNPVFGELPLNAAFRPWLTAIVDMRSRRVVGQVWCVTPSSNTISDALREALRSYGLCQVFYIDNGKDYKKLGKSSPDLSPDAQGVLVRLGIKSQHCLPKHPQSKQIESFFRTLHKQFDVLWGDAYCGTSPATRPDFCDELLRTHKKLVALGDVDNSPLPAAGEFIRAAANWMDAFNTNFKHSGRGMAGRTPAQIYDAELPPQKRKPVNPADVAQLFWDRQKRVVSEGGCVQLFNARYAPADAESAAALMLQIKREVLVACSPNSVGEAIALTDNGRFLGHLRAQELLVHGDTPVEVIRSSMRARRKVFKATRHYLSSLQRHRTLAGDPTELEALTRRAAVNAVQPIIHALPVARAVNAPAPRLHVDDVVENFFQEKS